MVTEAGYFEEGTIDSRFIIRAMIQKSRQIKGKEVERFYKESCYTSGTIRGIFRRRRISKGTEE